MVLFCRWRPKPDHSCYLRAFGLVWSNAALISKRPFPFDWVSAVLWCSSLVVSPPIVENRLLNVLHPAHELLTKPHWWVSNQPCCLWMSFWGCCGLKAGSIAAFLSLPLPPSQPGLSLCLISFLWVPRFVGGPITGPQFPWISPMGEGVILARAQREQSLHILYWT